MNKLLPYLQTIYSKYNNSAYIQSDPISLTLNYQRSQDKEASGFTSALFSYGSIPQIQLVLKKILSQFGNNFVENLVASSEKDLKGITSGIYYRFYTDNDIFVLLKFLKMVYSKYDSLENYFFTGQAENGNYHQLIFNRWNQYLENEPKSNGLKFMMSNPLLGSANKRLLMFLRWMVRKDNIDLGLWKLIAPEQLLFPLDTHTSRICYYLGLTNSETANLKNAQLVTENLKFLCKEDPVKFDFAISRLGILQECPKRKNIEKCFNCSLYNVCQR